MNASLKDLALSPIAAFDLAYRFDGRILRAEVCGETGNFDSALAYWSAIAEEVCRVRPAALLVVDDSDGDALLPDQMERLVHSMVGRGLEGVRMAYVETDSQLLAQIEVAEIVARDAGYVVRVFWNELDAMRWLRHGEE